MDGGPAPSRRPPPGSPCALAPPSAWQAQASLAFLCVLALVRDVRLPLMGKKSRPAPAGRRPILQLSPPGPRGGREEAVPGDGDSASEAGEGAGQAARPKGLVRPARPRTTTRLSGRLAERPFLAPAGAEAAGIFPTPPLPPSQPLRVRC